jgi:hypothetical protein
VTSAFLIDIQGELKPDYMESTAKLLLILIQEVKNPGSSTIPSDLSSLDQSPDPIVVTVQAILYASLASSLLAAFLAVLGKQWLNRYVRGNDTGIERNYDRQVKLDGMKMWYFSIVMEALPLMLQAALLLFACALSRYIWTINPVVAIVNITFTALGVLFYILIVVLATFSYDCPYQTPFSVAFRYILGFDATRTKYIPRIIELARTAFAILTAESTRLYRRICAMCQKLTRNEEGLPMNCLAPSSPHPCTNGSLPEDTIDPLSPIHDQKTEMKSHALDAACITWILEQSTDIDVTHSALQCIPDVEWHPHIKMATPQIEVLQDAVLKCLDRECRVVPGARNKFFASLKAFVHYLVHLNTRRDRFPGIHPLQLPMSSAEQFSGPFWDTLQDRNDLDLAVVGWLFSDAYSGDGRDIWENLIHWKIAEASPPLLIWAVRTLVHRLWWSRRWSGRLYNSKDIFLFVLHLLELPTLPGSVAADLITIVALKLGMPLHIDSLSVSDKR